MDRLAQIMAVLPGIKILVRGNHDHYRIGQLQDAGFHFVCDGFRIGEIYFSHEPTRRLPEFVRLNIHGHFHKDGQRFLGSYAQFPWYADYPERYLLAEVETDLGPILLREFLDRNGREGIDINGRRPYDYLIPEINATVV
jgi:calcineurin-like phosphoesterase family protein